MNKLSKYLQRFVICALIFGIYIIALRPVRSMITQKVVYPVLSEARSDHPSPYAIANDGVALRISFPWGSAAKEIQYRPSAGFFFLIGICTLVFAGAARKSFGVLLGFHLFMTCFTALLIFLSRTGWYTGFIIVDLFVSYLIPAVTLAYVGWVVSNELKEGSYEKDT